MVEGIRAGKVGEEGRAVTFLGTGAPVMVQ